MPKGGAERTQRRIDQETGLGRGRHEQLRSIINPMQQQFLDNYNTAYNRQMGDYGNIMGQYKDFAATGGFSPQDISNMRARAMSPLRASYSAASRNVDRQRALQGGYSPGYGVLQSRLAREQGQGMSDAARSAEADIAQMRQQGRLSGMAGMAGMYGATPGQTALFGSQALQSLGQLLNLGQMENQFGQGMTNAQIAQGQMPGKWQQMFDNILKGGSAVGRILYPWMTS